MDTIGHNTVKFCALVIASTINTPQVNQHKTLPAVYIDRNRSRRVGRALKKVGRTLKKVGPPP